MPFGASAPAPRPLSAPDAFLRAVRCPSGRIDVLGAAIAVAADARPEVDGLAIRETISRWADRLSRRIAHAGARDEPLTGVLLLNRLLFEEEGFMGDVETPHDPGNSEIDKVLERRRGLPITMGLLQIEVGKRAGLPLHGISFPGRFLVGLATAPRALLFDPFRGGRVVLPEECQGLLDQRRSGLGDEGLLLRLRPEFLRPCPPDRFIERLLTNLKHAYLRQADIDAAIRVQGRIVDLRPSQPGPLQERARLAFQAGRHDDAIADLEIAVSLASEAPGASGETAARAARRQLEQVRRWMAAMRWRSA